MNRNTSHSGAGPAGETPRVLWEGKYLCLASRGTWEYVTRTGISGVVGIVAITQDQRVVLVEQYRPPTDCSVIELPAGLAGDHHGIKHEPLVEAAKRELLEETGYEASRWKQLTSGFTSPGMTDESITFFLAQGLARTGPGGGDGSEAIVVHEVALADVMTWLDARYRNGVKVDLKLFSGCTWRPRLSALTEPSAEAHGKPAVGLRGPEALGREATSPIA